MLSTVGWILLGLVLLIIIGATIYIITHWGELKEWLDLHPGE